MQPFCSYGISYKVDNGADCTVRVDFYEGDYQNVIENGQPVNRYIPANIFDHSVLYLEHSPATDAEIKDRALAQLNLLKGARNVIPEQL